ncbi:MAG: twin-arginine translocase TatA/TatE family subunit [Alphaproteobacteria bacterium]|nr:twin-arginine translocase TatA/TatE family subunit [Alphaproteobacteria bacterium]
MAPGPLQIAIVLLLILIVFGAGRVPAIAENLAKGINSFKKGLKDNDDEPKKLDKSSSDISSDTSKDVK